MSLCMMVTCFAWWNCVACTREWNNKNIYLVCSFSTYMLEYILKTNYISTGHFDMTMHGFLGQNQFQFVFKDILHQKYNFIFLVHLQSITDIESPIVSVHNHCLSFVLICMIDTDEVDQLSHRSGLSSMVNVSHSSLSQSITQSLHHTCYISYDQNHQNKALL